MAVTNTDRWVRLTHIPVPRNSIEGGPGGLTSYQLMRLRVEHPEPGRLRVSVYGDVDALTAPRLEELLTYRLRSQIEALTVDLSALNFLGFAGLDVLRTASLRASVRGIDMYIVLGRSHAARRACEVTGFGQDLPVVLS